MCDCTRGHLPFALPQRPTGNDPQRDHEYQQHSTGANGHESLEHESCIEIDAVQSTDTPGRSVSKQFAMQQHDSADEVEAEEHGQGQGDVVRHPFRADVAALVGQFRGPQEVVLARDRVHRADAELQPDLGDPLPRHSDPPVVGAVVDHEQLQARNKHIIIICQ